MKRPTSTKPLDGEHIPARRKSGPTPDVDQKAKAEGLLSKLGPQDVLALVGSVTSLAKEVTGLQQEKERTAQAAINARVKMEEIGVERERVLSDRDVRIKELRKEGKSSKYRHVEAMKDIERSEIAGRERQKNIDRIISMVESGSVTPEVLAMLISKLGER